MKYIKNFNEELQPDIYRRAAGKFRHYGKEDKARKLSDWADLQEYGFYNLHFANGSTLIGRNLPFTKPNLTGIFLTSPNTTLNQTKENVNSVNLINAKETYIEEQVSKLVKNWVDGGELNVYFEFGFRPTAEAIVKTNKHSYLTGGQKGGGRWMYEVPAFTICLSLSEWNDGLEDYDSDAKWEAQQDDREFIPTTVEQFYEWTSNIQYDILKPYDKYYFAIFSDRKSAQKFRTFLMETLNSEKVKDIIMEILRVINCSAEKLEEIFKSYNDIKIHGLYDQDPENSNCDRKWFNKRIDY